MVEFRTLTQAAVATLKINGAVDKAIATRALVGRWREKAMEIGDCKPPPRPGRPERPALRPPREVPRRRITASIGGRIPIVHAIAHIELNAVDLALDMTSRYTSETLPNDFYEDWLNIADDEARHFLMMNDLLEKLDTTYGDLPAHDGLWEAADATKHDLLARLAIAPLVLEARGLDVTPKMIDQFETVGDRETANALSIIMTDEVKHVATGKRWFDYVCGMRRLDPVSTWHQLVKRYFHGDLKPPFNIAARSAARFAAAFYEPLSERDDLVESPTAKDEA
jgi:uncharacterized ferritin-like protein (DUF455 family)